MKLMRKRRSKIANDPGHDMGVYGSGKITINTGKYEITLAHIDEFYGDDKSLYGENPEGNEEYHTFSIDIKINKDGRTIHASKDDGSVFVILSGVELDEKEIIEAIRQLMQKLFNITRLAVNTGTNKGSHSPYQEV